MKIASSPDREWRRPLENIFTREIWPSNACSTEAEFRSTPQSLHCAALAAKKEIRCWTFPLCYLTVRQAADYIGRSKSFEYLMSKKMFPVIRRDRLVLIDKNDLDCFMTEQKR